MKDLQPFDRKRAERIAALIVNELESASKKFGAFNSTHEGYGVIKEEFDEAWDAIKRDNFLDAKIEMIQMGAMVMRFIYDLAFSIPKNGWKSNKKKK